MSINTTVDAVTTITFSKKNVELAVRNYSGSIAYIKQLLRLSVVNIIKHRIDYEENNFVTRTLNDVPYVVISPTTAVGGDLYNLYFWLKDATIPIEERYLETLYAVIRRRDTKEVIEHYKFNIKYLPKEIEKIVEESVLLDNTSKIFSEILNCLEGQTKLKSKDISLALQLTLNEDAPAEYSTPHFVSKDGYIKTNEEGYVNFGKVGTPYHKVTILGKGVLYEDNISASLNTKLSTNKESKKLEGTEDENLEPNQKASLYREGSLKDSEILTLGSNSADSLDNANIDCVCSIKYCFKNVPLIQCQICEGKTHVPCVGYESINGISQPFTCYKCCISRNEIYQDSHSSKTKVKTQYITYTQARLLVYCILYCDYTVEDIINKIPKEFLNFFLKKMTSCKMLELSNDEYIVNKNLVGSRISLFHKEYDSRTLEATENQEDVEPPKKKQFIN